MPSQEAKAQASSGNHLGIEEEEELRCQLCHFAAIALSVLKCIQI